MEVTFNKLQEFLKNEVFMTLDFKFVSKISLSFYLEGFHKKQDDKNRHDSFLKPLPENTIESIFNLEGFHNHNILHAKYKVKFQHDVLYVDLIKRLPNYGFLSSEEVAKMTLKAKNQKQGFFGEGQFNQNNGMRREQLFALGQHNSEEQSVSGRVKNNDSFPLFDDFRGNSLGHFGKEGFTNNSFKFCDNSQGLNFKDFKDATKIINESKADGNPNIANDKSQKNERSKNSGFNQNSQSGFYKSNIDILYSKISKLN